MFSVVYLFVRRLLACQMVLARGEVSKDAELLVLRHENAVLPRQIGRVRYQPGDRLWLTALAPSTVWQILKDARIDPARRRDGPGWAEFLRSQAQAILALDLFTADLLNGTTVYVLAVIEHAVRRVRVLGATQHPAQSWVVQQARNLAHGPGGCWDTSEVCPA
jgi:hypothetical protein